jgi:SulP family sulfate permease
LARVKQDLRADLDAAGFVTRVGEERLFPTLPTAVHAYLEWYAEQHGGPPAGVDVPDPPPTPLA